MGALLSFVDGHNHLRLLHPCQMLNGTKNANRYGANSPFKLIYKKEPDYRQLRMASRGGPIHYPKPDGKLSFDKLSSVYLTNTSHDEDQHCHLKLQDDLIPVKVNLPTWG